MATSTRSQRIRTNVQRIVDKSLRSEESSPEAIYDAINAVQEKIVEETLCLDGTVDIVLYGQQFYGLPDDFIAIKGITGEDSLTLIDFAEVERLFAIASDTDDSTDDSTSDTPLKYYFHDGQIGFLTSSGSYPSSGTLTLYYYRQLDSLEYAKDTTDPAINSRWDRTLFYGAVCELIQDGAWERKYEVEYARRFGRQVQTATVGREVSYNSSYD